MQSRSALAQWERSYLQVLRDLLSKAQGQGRPRDDRTGTGTASMFGLQLKVPLKHGQLPALVTKHVHLKSVAVELLWFISGSQSTDYLKQHGVSIWDEWANKGEVGPMYGHQWRNWDGPEGQVDQLNKLIIDLLVDPFSRRHVVTAWNPAVLPVSGFSPQENVASGRAALAACHCLFQCYVEPMSVYERVLHAKSAKLAPEDVLDVLETKTQVGEAGALLDQLGAPRLKLSMRVDQRSADWFLGVPFNIASYALLTHLLCKLCGYAPGELTMQFGDVHLYVNHAEQAQEQLDRAGRAMQGDQDIRYPLFGLRESCLGNDVNLDDVTLDDILIGDYRHMGRIVAPIAV